MDLVRAGLAALLFILLSIGNARAQTQESAQAACAAYAAQGPCWAAPSTCGAVQCNTGEGAILAQCPGSYDGGVTCTSTLNTVRTFPFDQGQVCNLEPGTVTSSGISHRPTSEYGSSCDRASNCTIELVGTDNASCFDGRCYEVANWTTTGATCGSGDDEEDDTEDDEICEDVGGGYQQCWDGDKICVKSPSGARYCWSADDADGCQQGSTEAACVDPDEPTEQDDDDEWEPGPTFTFNNSRNGGSTTTDITTYTNSNSGGDDGDGDEDDPDGDGDEDEEDDDEDISAHVGACNAGFSCSGGDHVLCAQLKEQHKARCELEGQSKQLDILKDRLTSIRDILRDKGAAQVSGDCATPPSCSGNAPGTAILCAQLRSDHNTKCAIERAVKGGGTASVGVDCGTPPACSADHIQCAQLRQAHKDRCEVVAKLDKVAKTLAGNAGTGGEPCNLPPPPCEGPEVQCAMLREQRELRCGLFAADQGQGTDPAEGITERDMNPWRTRTIGLENLNGEGFLGGGGCPQMPALPFGVHVSNAFWCDFLAVMNVISIIGGSLAGLLILLKR